MDRVFRAHFHQRGRLRPPCVEVGRAEATRPRGSAELWSDPEKVVSPEAVWAGLLDGPSKSAAQSPTPMPRSGSAKAAGGGLSRDPIALKVKVIEALGNSLRNNEIDAFSYEFGPSVHPLLPAKMSPV